MTRILRMLPMGGIGANPSVCSMCVSETHVISAPISALILPTLHTCKKYWQLGLAYLQRIGNLTKWQHAASMTFLEFLPEETSTKCKEFACVGT